jgi:hypothetical protein
MLTITQGGGGGLDNLTDYQRQVLAAMGLGQSADQETGSTNWIDRNADDGTARINNPEDFLSQYLGGFGGNHGTAGYVDAGARLPNGYSGVDPSVQNAFKSTIDLNGKNYFRADSLGGGLTYDQMRNASPEYAQLMQQYGITPQDFASDPTYGNMLENNPRTAKFNQAREAKTQKESWLSSFLTSMPVVMGSFGMGALAAPALAAELAIPVQAAKAGLGMIPSALMGNWSPTSLIGLGAGFLGGGGIGDAASGAASSASSGIGDWFSNLFGGGNVGSTASSAGGAIGGGMFDDFDNFDSSFGGVNYDPNIDYSGMSGLEQYYNSMGLPQDPYSVDGVSSRDPGTELTGYDPANGLPFSGSNLGSAAGLLSKLLGGGGAAGAGGSLLGGLLGNNSLAGLLGGVGSAALGYLGARDQTQAYERMQDKYLSLGQPYRDKLAASYQPGFDMSSDPAYQGALDQASNSVLRKLSATGGNPFDNPGGVMEANKYVTQNVALPQLNTYRSQLGSFGQLGTNQAGTAGLGAAQSAGGTYDALGAGLQALTKPQDPYADLFKNMKLGLGGSF